MKPRLFQNRLVYSLDPKPGGYQAEIPDNISVASHYSSVQEAAAEAINRFGTQLPQQLMMRVNPNSPHYQHDLAKIVGYILSIKNKGHIRKLLELIGARTLHDMFDNAKTSVEYHKQAVVALLSKAPEVGRNWEEMSNAWKYIKNSQKIAGCMSQVFSLVSPAIEAFCGENQVVPPNYRELPRQTKYSEPSVCMDSVDVDFIASVLCPQRFTARAPDAQDPIPTAILPGRNTYTITTNASGNALVVFVPSSIVGANVVAYLNDVTYSPATGAQTPPAVLIPGPQNSNSATIRTFRITKFTTVINDTLPSLTAQGMVSSAVYYEMPNGSFVNLSTMSLPTQDINMSKQAVICGIHNLEYSRRTMLPLTPALQDLVQLNGANLLVVYSLQGLSASTPVTFTMNYALQYIPISSMQGVISTQFPKLAPATFPTLGAIQSILHGQLSRLTFKQASELAQRVITGENKMTEVVGRLSGSAKKLKIGSWNNVAQHVAHTALDVIPHLVPLVAGDSVQMIGTFGTQIPQILQPICVQLEGTDAESCYYDTLKFLDRATGINSHVVYNQGVLTVDGKSSQTPVSMQYVLNTCDYPLFYFDPTINRLIHLNKNEGKWGVLVSSGHAVPIMCAPQLIGSVDGLQAAKTKQERIKALQKYELTDQDQATKILMRLGRRKLPQLMRAQIPLPAKNMILKILTNGKKQDYDVYQQERKKREEKNAKLIQKLASLKTGNITVIQKTRRGFVSMSLQDFSTQIASQLNQLSEVAKLVQENMEDSFTSGYRTDSYKSYRGEKRDNTRREEAPKVEQKRQNKYRQEKKKTPRVQLNFPKGHQMTAKQLQLLEQAGELPSVWRKVKAGDKLKRDLYYYLSSNSTLPSELSRYKVGSYQPEEKKKPNFVSVVAANLSTIDGSLQKRRNNDGKMVFSKLKGTTLYWYNGKNTVQELPLEQSLLEPQTPAPRIRFLGFRKDGEEGAEKKP